MREALAFILFFFIVWYLDTWTDEYCPDPNRIIPAQNWSDGLVCAPPKQ